MIRFHTLVLITLYSCGSRMNYLGSSYTPSKKIDVFVDASTIKQPYTIMGKGYMHYGVGASAKSMIDKMQTRAIEKAKAKGADAILFQDFIVKRDGSNVQTITKTDSVGKGLVTIETGTIGPVLSTGTNILFLKYN